VVRPIDLMVLIRLSKRSSNPMGSIKTDLDKSEPRGQRALLILRKSYRRLWNVKVVVLHQKIQYIGVTGKKGQKV
jgi:hypothetical protein